MHTPYTASPDIAFLVANGATGVTAMVITWTQRNVLRWGTAIVFMAIACMMIANPLPGFLLAIRRPIVDPMLTLTILRAGAWCFLAGALLARAPLWTKVVAVIAHYFALEANEFFTESNWELTVMHLTMGMAIVGLVTRSATHPTPGSRIFTPDEERAQDVAHFVIPTLLAVLVGKYVLRWGIDSSDEWAYTFQAHTYAKLESYSTASPCGHSFQNFWVFDWEGRRFSQYTPGWPLFLVPFVWTRSVWLAGPTSLGILAIVVGRLARRLVDVRVRPWAASAAVATLALSTTCLINGGSRFPHLWVAACFAWSLEALLRCGEVTTLRERIAWGTAFGFAVAWLLATRPSDGALLGSGIFVLFLAQVVRRRISPVTFAAGVASSLLLGGWTLWVLHRQLGTWFTTGYSLSTTIYPWNKFEFEKPLPNEWKWGLQIATGAYCWFPASTALGFYGLARARPGARTLAAAMVVSVTTFFVFYSYLKLGHGNDWGYGPRYELPTIALWSVGTGAAVSSSTLSIGKGVRRWLEARAIGPFVAVSVSAALVLAPLLYPINTDSLMKMEVVNDRVREMGIHNAVVIVGHEGTGERGGLDYTQNLPIDLYPDQSVLIAQPLDQAEDACLRDTFQTRSFWDARGNPVTITRLRTW